MEFQQQKQAKSDRIKNQLLIPQGKVLITIKFKSQTFVLPTPKDFVLPKKSQLNSPPSNLEFPYFLPKKNLFYHSKTNPTCLEKENSFTLPFPHSFSSIYAMTASVTAVVTTAIATVSNDTTVVGEIDDRATTTTSFVNVTIEDEIVIVEDVVADAAVTSIARTVNGKDLQAIVVACAIDREDYQVAAAAPCRLIGTTAGKRIAIVEGNVVVVATTEVDPTNTAPSVGATIDAASVVGSLAGKFLPITSACEEDDIDTYRC